MIQQPELGKKITDLRKEKGLTQEELVEKCNLNVRTLQRIEAGEVTPRTYTIRLIFEALDYSLEKSKYDKGLIPKWLEQFYISFLDLFNLKTNTMKKISILAVLVTAIVIGVFAANTKLSAQNNDNIKEENVEIENVSRRAPNFSNFSCHGCMVEKGLMIGRDVSFTLSGVKVKNIKLIIMDENTREFKAVFIKGVFLERKVEAEYSRDRLIDGNLKYSADEVKESHSNILLKGNAMIVNLNDKDNPDDNEIIQADEILITLK
jgi:transcriptional regulator with XRE-family HTH domain